jgi:formiminotetrahydrofolate cyclodeaminase
VSLLRLSARELLAAFAAPTATPGGGSAAALAGALGGALLIMVALLPKTRNGTEEDVRVLRQAARGLNGHRERLQQLVDEDSDAYEAVVLAYRLPKEGDAARRRDAIQKALRGATDVPLEVMRLTLESIRHGAAVARHGNAAASSDLGVGLELLRAAFAGAARNVRVNLHHVKDADYAASTNADLERLETDMPEATRVFVDALDGA